MMVVSQPYAMLIDKSLHLSHHMSGLRSPLKFDEISKTYSEENVFLYGRYSWTVLIEKKELH